jgi:membrane protein DedA with SNARE-associated domain
VAGAILFALLLFWGIDAFLTAYGFVIIPYLLVIGVLVIGGWLGERLGCLLGNWLQERSLAKAGRRSILPQFEAIWFSLEHNLKTLLKVYEST